MSTMQSQTSDNLLFKILFAAIGAWIVGRPTNMKIRGSAEEIRAFKNVLLATRNFQDELLNRDATVESVMIKLGLKHGAATEFEHLFKFPWPL